MPREQVLVVLDSAAIGDLEGWKALDVPGDVMSALREYNS